MLKLIADIKSNDDNLNRILSSLKELNSLEVLVGIPEDENIRTGEETDNAVTNAQLLYIHTNGSPVNKIPPRPVIEPAISDDKENIGEIFKKATQKAMEGNIEGMRGELERAGLRGENVSKGWFTNPKNGWQPNLPVTINRKASSRPLIDTGELRKSITHVIRKK